MLSSAKWPISPTRYASSALVGLRYALGVAWLSLVVAEQINAESGIGFLVMTARDFLRTDIILVGLGNTLFYTVTSFILGLIGGMVLALMRMSSFPPYRWLATAYVEFFRGVPALLVFLALGYGVPFAFGVSWPIPLVVCLALGLVASAYIAETLRAGLQAVPKGQMEAARSLGMPLWRAMVTIVIPQAFRIVLPPLTNEVILLTKDSSLVYVLGLAVFQYDLTKFGRDGIASLGAGMTPIVVAGILYLVITVPLSLLARRFESKSARKKV